MHRRSAGSSRPLPSSTGTWKCSSNGSGVAGGFSIGPSASLFGIGLQALALLLWFCCYLLLATLGHIHLLSRVSSPLGSFPCSWCSPHHHLGTPVNRPVKQIKLCWWGCSWVWQGQSDSDEASNNQQANKPSPIEADGIRPRVRCFHSKDKQIITVS